MGVPPPRDRIVYVDVLRAMAIMGVVLVHAAGDVFARSSYPAHDWMVSAIFVGLGYWAVPCFLMISGVLVLDSDASQSLPRHYKKTLLRLVIPFLVWSAIYPLFYNWTGIRQIPWEIAAQMVFESTRSTAPHLWFSYVIIGLYLVAPLIKRLLAGLDARLNAATAVGLCLVVFFALVTLAHDLSAVFDMSVPRILSPPAMVVYLGYFVAGHMLHRWCLEGRVRHIWMLVGILSIAMVYLVGVSLHWYRMGVPLNDRTALFSYRSVPLVVMSLAIFLLAKWQGASRRGPSWLLREISANAYGIYLCHMLFIKAFQKLPALDGFRQLEASQWILIPTKACVVFLGAFFLAAVLRRIPRIGWVFA